MSRAPLELDGSQGEGGGQVLRTSLTLALLTGRPFAMHSIRAGRRQPGLRPQHLAAVRAAAALCCARVQGDALGSLALRFEPGPVRAGTYAFDVGTAGSTTLILQTIALPLAVAGEPSTVRVTGGTHNPLAPPFEALERSFLPALALLGHRIDVALVRPGFFPRGGGTIEARWHPARTAPPAVAWTHRADAPRLRAHVLLAHLPRHVAEREVDVLVRGLRCPPRELEVEVAERADALGAGNALSLCIASDPLTEVYTELGARGLPAERVAWRLVERARTFLASDVPVGEHLADQLLLPLALAGGGTFRTLPPTNHTRTQAALLSQWLGVRIAIEEAPDRRSARVDVHSAA